MYIALTGSENNKDVHIYHSFRKENRPNPIVTMGLFMDADGIPLAFDVYPGNQNEQTTLKPLESKILQDFNCSEFIYCSDSGLGSAANRRFNSLGKKKHTILNGLKSRKSGEQNWQSKGRTEKSSLLMRTV